jgi:ribonucleoside-triphosphate reductase
MNEVGLNANWLRADMTSEKTQAFAKDVLNHMRERLSDYQEMYGDLYNLEATPAESTTYRFAKHDREQFPDIITAGKEGDTPFYTNSSHMPVEYTSDIFDALEVQDELQTLYTSGTVFHAFIGEKLPTWESAANLVRKIAENYRLPYYTLSPTYSVCKEHGYIAGEHYTCPHCGKTAEVYSRITGYYRPVQNWNEGKTQEFKNRKLYDIAGSVCRRAGEQYKQRVAKEMPEVNLEIVSEEPATGVKYLFTTKTCPNCARAKEILEDEEYILVDAEEQQDLTKKYGVMQAPTLVVVNGDDVKRYANASNIQKYVDEN